VGKASGWGSSSIRVLTRFADIAVVHGDAPFAETLPGLRAAQLRPETSRSMPGDGEWYRRAYFDDGLTAGLRPLTPKCQIDSIAQKLVCIIRRRLIPDRIHIAMESLDKTPGSPRPGALIQLLDPPFDKSPMEPRLHQRLCSRLSEENGGQYTHAAVWATHGVRRRWATPLSRLGSFLALSTP